MNDARSLVCEHCWKTVFASKAFHKAWNNQFEKILYTTNRSTLKASSDQGCNWCNFLQDKLGPYGGEDIDVSVGFMVNDGMYWPDTGDMVLFLSLPGHFGGQYIVQADEGICNPDSYRIRNRGCTRDVSSDRTFELAVKCMEECKRTHKKKKKCKRRRTPLPTRVIDCSDPKRPKLLAPGNGATGLYAALSYVWGVPTQPHSVNTTNINAYLSPSAGIDLQLVPKTIRDGIYSTHALGLRYLWVDSYCILQDSKEDKSREVAQMKNIFQNADVVLIAASARTVDEGFLHRRVSCAGEVCLPFLCPDDRNIGSIVISKQQEIGEEIWEPVDKRAWCLEERLLSRRGFVYTSRTVQYYCQTHTVNVGGRSPDIDHWKKRRLPQKICPGGGGGEGGHQKFSSREISRLRNRWYEIVHNYTTRTVTEECDKLPALAGIAELFCPVWSGSRYLAGLWERDFPENLLWCSNSEPKGSFPLPTKYRAPSWSWAAVDGPIINRRFDFPPDKIDFEEDSNHVGTCTIVNCNTPLADENAPFGMVVEGGALTVRAPLSKIFWNINEGSFSFKQEDKEERRSLVSAHRGEEKGNNLWPPQYRIWPDSNEASQLGLSCDVWAMPVIWNFRQRLRRVEGLVLVPYGKKRRYFRRVGIFSGRHYCAQFSRILGTEITCFNIV